MKSRAMVVSEPGRMSLEEFEVVKPPPGHLLVKTSVTSVCSTDIKVFKGRTPFGRYPLIMGHEIAGEVLDVGEGPNDWPEVAVGERITVEPYIPCGRCEWSRSRHFYHQCPHGGIYGISRPCDEAPHLFGGYSEYFYVVPGTILHRLGNRMPASAASLSSVVANGVRWVKTLGKVGFGESVVISGPGSQGLSALASALESGASPVIVLGLSRDGERLALAREFGAHHTVDVERDDPREVVRSLLPDGADAVIETSGTPQGILAAVDMVRAAGRIVSIGLSGGLETPVRFDDLVWKSVTLITGLGQAGNVGDAMKLIDTGRYPFERINNRSYRLDELAQAIRDTEERPEGFIKGAVIFGGD
jgi:threonine dehydrogenase-like Zn-dependent dehydrogenase